MEMRVRSLTTARRSARDTGIAAAGACCMRVVSALRRVGAVVSAGAGAGTWQDGWRLAGQQQVVEACAQAQEVLAACLQVPQGGCEVIE